MDDYSGLGTPVGGNAPAPAPDQITPEAYFAQVKSIYPNATFNGGGRTPERNASVGGVPDSMHLTDQAMDFSVPGVPSSQVFSKLKASGLPMTESLAEGQVGNQGAHLHVGWAPKSGVPASDPYSGLGATTNNPPHPSVDPYAGLGQPVTKSSDPYAGLGQPVSPKPAADPNDQFNLSNVGKAVGEATSKFNNYFAQEAQSQIGAPIAAAVKANAPYQAPAVHNPWDVIRGLAGQEVHDVQGVSALGGALMSVLPPSLAIHAGLVRPASTALSGLPMPTLPGQAPLTQPQREQKLEGMIGTSLLGAGSVEGADFAASSLDAMKAQKANVDVTQDLTQPGMNPPSDFTKSLFIKRGVSTTPPETPQSGQVSPITEPDRVNMSDEDKIKYQNLLATGDTDDIKNFFQGRNGPQPSYEDINGWVNHRDSMTVHDPMEDTHLQPQAPGPDVNELHRQDVENHINSVTSDWKNAPDFEVVHGPEDIQDPAMRAQALAGEQDGPKNGFFGRDGKVRVYSKMMADPDMVNAVTFHEGLGHFGLSEMFGDKLDATLRSLLDRNVNGLAKETDAWQKQNPRAYNGDRIRAAEEVLAERSESGQVKASWSDAMSAAVRQFGRKMGLKLSYSDGEVNQILAMAHDAVINGKGRDVASNGYATNSQKFMYAGKKAQGFYRDNPRNFEAPDNKTRFEINDKDARLKTQIFEHDKLKLGDVLDHPDLYDHYPQLKNVNVQGVYTNGKTRGFYAPNTHTIGIDATVADQRSTLLHEVQHVIQHIEDHAGGTTSDLNNDSYRKSFGEIEARDTQHRMNFNDHMRDILPPYKSQGIAPEDMDTEGRFNGYPPSRFSGAEQLQRSMARRLERNDDYTGALEETAKAYEDYHGDVVSVAETKRRAENLGMSPSQIHDLGEAGDLTTKIARMGGALNMAKARLADFNEKLDSTGLNPLEKSQYLKTVADYNLMMAKFLGHGSEMGRALNMVRQIGFTRDTLENVSDLLKGTDLAGMANDETFLKFAKAIKAQMDEGNDAGTAITMKALQNPYWEQYLTTLWHNSMLSSLATHFKSSLDMINGIGLDAQERYVAMGIGKARSLIPGQGPGRTLGEASAYSEGALRSIANMEMWRAAKHAIKTGEGSFATPHSTNPLGKQVSQRFPTNTNSFGTIQNPRIPNKFGGGLLNKPIDMISAQDTIFRSVAIAGHIYDQAARMAREKLGPKASGDDARILRDTYAHNPTTDMINKAKDAADHTLLMNANPLNTFVDKGRIYTPGMSVEHRLGTFFLNTITPFIRVESNNLWSRFVMRSPLGWLDKSTRAQIAMGGKDADIALARMAYGTIKMGIYWAAADKGANWIKSALYHNKQLIGNAPANADKRKEFEAGGGSFDTVHENGRFQSSDGLNTSLNPFDLHNNTASMVASARDAWDNTPPKDKIGLASKIGISLKLAGGSVMHDLASQSWVHDIGPDVDAALDTDSTAGQKFTQVATNQVTNFYPNILTQAAHMIDPNKHDVSATDAAGGSSILGTIGNTIESRIPGLSNNVPIRYSVYGTPLQNGASLTGVRTLGDFVGIHGNGTKEDQDPTIKELARLGASSPAAVITPVQHTVTLDDGTKKKLDTREFQNYQRVAGTKIVEASRQAMSDPGWSSMSDHDKIDTIRTLQTDAKADARDELFNGNQ